MDCHSDSSRFSDCIGWRTCCPPSDPCNMEYDQWECCELQLYVECGVLWESCHRSRGSYNNNLYHSVFLYGVMPYGILMENMLKF